MYYVVLKKNIHQKHNYIKVKNENLTYNVLHSLHRPFHRPLWIVKWVCIFYVKRQKQKNNYFYYQETIIDFYFTLLEWLYNGFPKDPDGIPSQDAINAVYLQFSNIEVEDRPYYLKEILSKEKRIGVEKQIYSTYKAASYYLNLAIDKLHFLDNDGNSLVWDNESLIRNRRTSNISQNDKKMYLRQVLRFDAHFFLSMCLLHRESLRYGLQQDEIVFDFLQRYYPIPRFDYIHRSHQNYYDVRSYWVKLLSAVSNKGLVNKTVIRLIEEDESCLLIYQDILNNINEYRTELRIKNKFNNQKKRFLSAYKALLKKQDCVNGYVDLYDLLVCMKMSYKSFSAFLREFYETERMSRNIFFINIVSTIDQKKRFYIRETPVLKIKIS